jgi:hypothetical protein
VRNMQQTDSPAKLRAVFQMGRDAAVVCSHKRLKYQAGKELVLGELLRTEAMAVG